MHVVPEMAGRLRRHWASRKWIARKPIGHLAATIILPPFDLNCSSWRYCTRERIHPGKHCDPLPFGQHCDYSHNRRL